MASKEQIPPIGPARMKLVAYDPYENMESTIKIRLKDPSIDS